jgi:DNA processing protein
MTPSAIRAIQRGDAEYPRPLATVDGAPPTLWVAGAWRPSRRAVAIVGARAASGRGMELAEELGARLAHAGFDIVSGGAIGIDAAAHRGALDAAGSNEEAGRTVAVLGTGVDVVYPARHHLLYEEILAKGGALVTQFPPGTQPRPQTFPIRNRVIAALAELVVIVEAGVQSGSLYTARAARELGRQVVALPGSAGGDGLILTGARAVASAADVEAVLEGRAPAPPLLPDDPAARRLYDVLDAVPRDVGDLAFRAGLAVGTCAAMVVDLELGGLAARAAGGRYVRLR